MRVASVCSGIGGAELAFAGIAEHVFAAEIDPFARAVLAQHFPHLVVHHDFTEITADGAVDVLVGGTPCQSFSIAGLRRGMADERGNLALEFLRLADRLRARWVLWENVPGVLSSSGGRDFGAFLGGLGELGYGFAYRILDAQYFGLAQRRKRVFVVGYLGDWRRAAAVLFEPANLRGNPAPSRAAREGIAVSPSLRAQANSSHRADSEQYIAKPLGAKRDGGWRGDIDNDTYVARCLNAHPSRSDGESETFVTHSLRADGFDASEDGTGRGTPLVSSYRTSGNCGAWDTGDRTDALNTGTDPASHLVAFAQNQRGELRCMDVAGALASEPGMKQQTYAFQQSQSGFRQHETHATLDSNNGSRRRNGVTDASSVRRLTPRECERLQGFPDDWTAITHRGKPAADGPRYRALGNAFAVPVVRWIARRMVQQHAQVVAAPEAA